MDAVVSDAEVGHDGAEFVGGLLAVVLHLLALRGADAARDLNRQVLREAASDVGDPAGLEDAVRLLEALLAVPPEVVTAARHDHIGVVVAERQVLGIGADGADAVSQAVGVGQAREVGEHLRIDVGVDPVHPRPLREFEDERARAAADVDAHPLLHGKMEIADDLFGQRGIDRGQSPLAGPDDARSALPGVALRVRRRGGRFRSRRLGSTATARQRADADGGYHEQ